MTRIASLVLITSTGELMGQLPAIELACPYWPESSDLVAAARARFGLRVTVLRLLWTERAHAPGGAVTYLAELDSGTPNVKLAPVRSELRELALGREPKRMAWAELGGPARSLTWARGALGRTFEPVQQRSWNLSTLWRLEPIEPEQSRVWLKQVPPFMRREGSVLRWLNHAVPGAAPELLAADEQGRSLLAHVEGEDLYGAPPALRQLIDEQLHRVQRVASESLTELLAVGVPDLRGPLLAASIRGELNAWSADYPGLPQLLVRLDEQLARLDECGLPATLVHGDNHPGNARGSLAAVALLDWGEAFIGNPVTDVLGLVAGLSPTEAAPLLADWCRSWKRIAPDCRPERALQLAPFVRELSGAALFASFVRQIEPSEQPYHRSDVPRCLEAARAAEG